LANLRDIENKSNRLGAVSRLPLVAAAIFLLLISIWAGWIRIGWPWPEIRTNLVGLHGPLMISGFFGTLISLERAVALRKSWAYLSPAASALGGLALLAGMPHPLGSVLLSMGSLLALLIFTVFFLKHRAFYMLVMAGGAASWLIGNLMLLFGRPVFELVLLWGAFLILTIAGERLELGRLRRLSRRGELLFALAAALYIIGVIIFLFDQTAGARTASSGLIALAAWLARFDVARWTVKQTGLPRFAAISLLAGYAWMAVGGIIGLIYGFVPAGPIYDAFLHTVFLGFVFSMIFAHAPIIFPAILNLPIRYSPVFYSHLLFLHLSLVLRIAGDLTFNSTVRMWGGLLNGLAILLFLGMTAWSIASSRAEKHIRQAPAA
jgi:hypothetical protein